MSTATISYIEIDVVGLLIIAVLIFARRPERKRALDQVLFDRLLYTGIVMLTLDLSMWVVDGRLFEGARIVNLAITSLYYMCECFIAYTWFIYVRFKLTGDKDLLERRRWWYLSLAFINIALSLTSIGTGWFFTVDPVTNVYARGNLFPIHAALCVVYLLVPTFQSWYRLRKTTSKEVRRSCWYLAIFPVIPLVALTVQAFLYGISLLWICVVVSYLMIYINVQNTQISTDGLTGINNRREMDDYLNLSIKNLHEGHQLGMVLIDIDDFKRINDSYGHGTGDQALIFVADVLKRTCGPTNYFLARMGGDEFVVIGECADENELVSYCDTLQAALTQANESSSFEFAIELSTGIALFDRTADDAASFLARADEKMYRVKAARKAFR